MRLFIDTGSVAEVEEIAAWGVLAGATTNPSLLAKEDGAPPERYDLRGAGRVDPPPRARGDGCTARLRGGDDPGQGASPDARSPTHDRGHRALLERLAVASGARRLARAAARGG